LSNDDWASSKGRALDVSKLEISYESTAAIIVLCLGK
jgi:hypothetical protein